MTAFFLGGGGCQGATMVSQWQALCNQDQTEHEIQ